MSISTFSFKTPGPTNGGYSVPDESDIPTMRPRTGPRATNERLAKGLAEALSDLARSPCSFWACRGPRNPRPMCTCTKCYAMREIAVVRSSLLARGTVVALAASLLCGTANAQGYQGPFGDLEMESHIETMQWLDRRYDQTTRDMERERMEDRLQRLEGRAIYFPAPRY